MKIFDSRSGERLQVGVEFVDGSRKICVHELEDVGNGIAVAVITWGTGEHVRTEPIRLPIFGALWWKRVILPT